MMRANLPFRPRGFTLVELMVGLTVVAVLLAIAAPSFSKQLLQQRLISIHAQVTTDLQQARSEAIARGVNVRVRFQAADGDSHACYVIYTDTNPEAETSETCNCKLRLPSVDTNPCAGVLTARELRTVLVPTSSGVSVGPESTTPDYVTFDARSGGLPLKFRNGQWSPLDDFSTISEASSTLRLRNEVGKSGRVVSCVPRRASVTGMPSC